MTHVLQLLAMCLVLGCTEQLKRLERFGPLLDFPDKTKTDGGASDSRVTPAAE